MLNRPEMQRLGLTNPAICSAVTTISPQEQALHSLCKQILRARLFRGYYEERRYVETVNGYRDIVTLQRSERDLEKLLLDLRQKIYLFYQHRPKMWIGITHGTSPNRCMSTNTLETSIWAELDDLAFGQYWFLIKSVRFRECEVLLKLKMVRAIEYETAETPTRRRVSFSASTVRTTSVSHETKNTSTETKSESRIQHEMQNTAETKVADQIDLQDFVDLLRQWGNSLKYTFYNFLANDISKENIRALMQILGLLLLTVMSSLVGAVKYLGVFTLRFMFEFSRLTQSMTPIIFKIIDVFNKMIGGFYILLTMIWKDTVNGPRRRPKAIEQYKSIEYNLPRTEPRKPRHVEFERKFQ